MVLTDDARGGKVQQKLPGYHPDILSSHAFLQMENTYSEIGSICFEKEPIMVLADDAKGGKVQQKLLGYLILSP